MNTQQTPAPERRNLGGRPALAEGQTSERINVRLTTVQRLAFEEAGGAQWLRRQLDALAGAEQVSRAPAGVVADAPDTPVIRG